MHPARHIRYVPLDEIDFERRGWVPESGWPFSRREIQPFYERAQQVCGIGKFDYRAGSLGKLEKKTPALANGKNRVSSLPIWILRDFSRSTIAKNSPV